MVTVITQMGPTCSEFVNRDGDKCSVGSSFLGSDLTGPCPRSKACPYSSCCDKVRRIGKEQPYLIEDEGEGLSSDTNYVAKFLLCSYKLVLWKLTANEHSSFGRNDEKPDN
jgi:hypothetical protein